MRSTVGISLLPAQAVAEGQVGGGCQGTALNSQGTLSAEDLRGAFLEKAFSSEQVDASILEDARAGVAECVFLGESSNHVK